MSTNTDLWAGAASPKERENRADKATGIKYLRQTLNLSEFEALAIITAQKFGLGLEVAVILGVRKLGLSQPDPLGRFSTLYDLVIHEGGFLIEGRNSAFRNLIRLAVFRPSMRSPSS